jgi:hypothetical protein
MVVAQRRDDRDSGEKGSVAKVIESVRTRAEKRRNKTLTTEEPLTAKAFRATWNAAIAEYASATGRNGLPSVSPKQAAIFLRSQGKASPLAEGWKEYIRDVVENWDRYMDHFSKVFTTVSARNLPEVPVFDYFLRMNARHFRPYYLKRQSGQVEREARIHGDSVERANRKIEKAEQEIALLRDELAASRRNEALTRRQVEQERRARVNQARSSVSHTIERLSDEAFQALLNEELPSWEEAREASRRDNDS